MRAASGLLISQDALVSHGVIHFWLQGVDPWVLGQNLIPEETEPQNLAGGDLFHIQDSPALNLNQEHYFMKTISKTLLAAMTVTAAFAVGAQESKVDLKNAKQQQSGGLANSQGANVGNATGPNSKSNVTATGITQSQSGGLANSQATNIGNATAGGKSNVTATNVTQSQSGGLANSQKTNIGNATAGGTSKVTATNVSQSQSGGLANSQTTNLGNATGSKAKTDVKATNVSQSQSGGLANSQTMNAGNSK
jgi:hypothetical protein